MCIALLWRPCEINKHENVFIYDEKLNACITFSSIMLLHISYVSGKYSRCEIKVLYIFAVVKIIIFETLKLRMHARMLLTGLH